ncbi:cytochrome P450 90D2-like isoform X2 [Nymphaea colorata]|uniref:cytochrome P450 90D2-like isoform X2 n=1 Tax=Nymphaea colorata TaxID=210225 RepID=UPI00129DCDB3|nr:cytochrome P450 90D2-like isoform X2 [Nymphaea colorata]
MWNGVGLIEWTSHVCTRGQLHWTQKTVARDNHGRGDGLRLIKSLYLPHSCHFFPLICSPIVCLLLHLLLLLLPYIKSCQWSRGSHSCFLRFNLPCNTPSTIINPCLQCSGAERRKGLLSSLAEEMKVLIWLQSLVGSPWFASAAITLIATVVLCLLWTSRFSRNEARLPQGTFGWPFIGESLEFIFCGYTPRPEKFMDKRIKRYGKVFKSHIFGSPTIVTTDAEVSKAVLQNDGRTFVPFYPKSITQLMGDSSILLINGGLQKRIHGLIGGFLKSPPLKAQITEEIENYVRVTMKSWQDGQLVYIQDEAKHAKKRMAKLVQRIIEEKRREQRKSCPRDVLDVLLEDTSQRLNKEMISDNLIDMMIPGEDSVPILITLAIKYLTDYPQVYESLLEENLKMKHSKEKLGQQLCWSDYLSMPFTQNVITETLRLGNVITGVMRRAMKDVVIKGHFIPKGWCVFPYFRSVHLDEQNYQDPYSFNPWRWQDRDSTSCYFTPFGGGHRLCPGVDLSRLEAAIFLHHLVTNYRWVAEEDSVVNFPTVRMKRKLPIRVQKLELA